MDGTEVIASDVDDETGCESEEEEAAEHDEEVDPQSGEALPSEQAQAVAQAAAAAATGTASAASSVQGKGKKKPRWALPFPARAASSPKDSVKTPSKSEVVASTRVAGSPASQLTSRHSSPHASPPLALSRAPSSMHLSEYMVLDESAGRTKPLAYWLKTLSTDLAWSGRSISKQIKWAEACQRRTETNNPVEATNPCLSCIREQKGRV